MSHPSDPLPDDINPGILRTVQWLRSHGYETCDSGDGVTHLAKCDRDHPYVVMRVAADVLAKRADELVALLNRAGLKVVSVTYGFDEDGGSLAPCIQASYDPVDGIALIDLMGVSDALLPANLP